MSPTARYRDPRRQWAAWIILLVYALALVWSLSSCSLCERAGRKVRWAYVHCPERFAQDSTTVVLPGDSVQGLMVLDSARVDSVVAACDQLAQALSAERELYAVARGVFSRQLSRNGRTLDSLQHLLRRRSAELRSAPAPTPRELALATLRGELCDFVPILDSTAKHRLAIWYTPQGIRYELTVYARTGKAPTMQVHTGKEPCGSLDGWWALALLAALLFMGWWTNRAKA